MINALIVDNVLGFTGDNIYVNLAFNYVDKSGEKDEVKTIITKPIFLIDKNETWDNSAAASKLALFFKVLGCFDWELVKGTNAQIELDENGNVTKIANIYDENKFLLLSVVMPEPEPESEGEVSE